MFMHITALVAGRPAGFIAGRPPCINVRPPGYYGGSGNAQLSPRKKKIVDWRDAQPSAVLPAGFRKAAHQVSQLPMEIPISIMIACHRGKEVLISSHHV